MIICVDLIDKSSTVSFSPLATGNKVNILIESGRGSAKCLKENCFFF